MEELSIRIFGTPDYQSVLDILPPYDGMVQLFNQEVEKLKAGLETNVPGNLSP